MYRATIETSAGSWLQFGHHRQRLILAVVDGLLKFPPEGELEGVKVDRVLCPPALACVDWDEHTRLPMTFGVSHGE